MNDLISREAAIDTIKALWNNAPSVQHVSAMFDCEDAIRALPSAQQWIPCSERLPKKSGQYYVSGGYKVWICEFLVIPNFTRGWCNDASNPAVQAWMPFPEPYRKDGD